MFLKKGLRIKIFIMLIIYAHPNKLGFSGYFLKSIQEKLEKEKIKYEILDLYAMSYDPVLKKEEHYTTGNHKISDQNKEIQEKIKEAKQLIFIYPIWWQNIPAILKGFLDRIFTPRFAFRYVNNFPKGLLKNKKAVIFTHTAGPRIFTKLIAGDRGLKVLGKDTLSFCGIKTKGFILSGARKLDEDKKNKINKIIKKGLKFLDF